MRWISLCVPSPLPVGLPLLLDAGLFGLPVLPSVLLWFANKDDERVQQLPQWQRDMFWIVPTDRWVSISTQGRNEIA